ncbi:uncharacterized protein LOC113151534 [Anabas testudineus]|uniref:uncharacterized protein LOC113151534 n=1 Tax=Anabas testudineus TaxID=64144 RepID=UPI000E4546CE|nr:uncharacterized protein LOC113151534 [Anabas testudineus]
MIFRILLLISLISCVSGTFVVNVTQTSYQAEENHNITLEWTFTNKPGRSSKPILIYCEQFNNEKSSVLFHLRRGFEVSESQDEQFSGRVQFDKDVLRQGRLRLQLTRLRTDDSGLYLCEVNTNYGGSSSRCRVSVTAIDQPKLLRPTAGPRPESRGWNGLIGLTAAVTAAGAILLVCIPLFLALRCCFIKCVDMNKNDVFLAIY